MHTLWHIDLLTLCETVYNTKHYFLTFWTKHHGLIPVIYWICAVGLLNIQQIMKASVTCALCCTAQYNTLRDEPSLQTFLFRHFFTKIRKIFTVRRKTRKLSKIRKTYAKNVRLDRYGSLTRTVHQKSCDNIVWHMTQRCQGEAINTSHDLHTSPFGVCATVISLDFVTPTDPSPPVTANQVPP